MQRRDDEIMKAVQERRLKGNLQVQNQVQLQPQKCPRCDSINTKFCYYNNYSLSQPRYLCKTCRRYWTQGGTLRNVPVGGGCRKGKRPKPSSQSSDSSRSTQLPPPPRPPVVQQSLSATPQPIIFSGTPVMTTSSYFNPGEEVGSSSRWINLFGSSQIGQSQIQASEIIYEMMDHHQSGKTAASSSSPAIWPETYINNNSSNPLAAVGDTNVWTSGDHTAAAVDQSSLDPNQWPDYMRGFCPPP